MTTNKETIPQNIGWAIMHGQSGSLKDLLEKINDPKIQALEDVLQFRKNYAVARQKMVDDSIAQVKLDVLKMIDEVKRSKLERETAIKNKSEELNQTISRLENELTQAHPRQIFFTAICHKIRKSMLARKIKYFKNKFQTILHGVTKDHDKRIKSVESKIKHTEDNIQTIANDNVSAELRRLDGINNTIEKEKYLVYGAIGETNVINELKKLPKTYHVINDFRIETDPPICNRAEDDRIYSVQADHLVAGPSGIFVIETKYWSNKSISNDALFSPVKQVKRAGFALFVLLNDAVKSRRIARLVNNWGERKISLKQIVASVNSVPHGEFQYVKVLGIEKLNSYITYGKQEFTAEEIRDIVDYLLHIGLKT